MQIYFCTLYLYPNNGGKQAVYKVQIKTQNQYNPITVVATVATTCTEAASDIVNKRCVTSKLSPTVDTFTVGNLMKL